MVCTCRGGRPVEAAFTLANGQGRGQHRHASALMQLFACQEMLAILEKISIYFNLLRNIFDKYVAMAIKNYYLYKKINI